MKRLVMLMLATGLAWGTQAAAAPAKVKRKKPVAEAPGKALTPRPRQSPEGPLAELSEALGALTLLSELCTPEIKPNLWRARMEALAEAEGAAANAREAMNGGFNRGYGEFSTSYSRCTPAARAAFEAMRSEAGRLARGINQRFGD